MRFRRHDERGAVAVEFALLAPLLIVFLFAIIEFGIALTRTITYVSAAREGARYAAVHCRPEASTCTNALIATRVTEAADGYAIGPGAPTADRDCTVEPGRPVTVTWVQLVPVDVPFLPDLSFTMNVSGTFRCE